MRNGNEHKLKEVVDRMFEMYRLKQRYNETSVVAHWEEIMGKMIANRTTKIFIKDKKLFLQLNSAPLKSELSLAKSKIIDLLNKRYQSEVIHDVVFL